MKTHRHLAIVAATGAVVGLTATGAAADSYHQGDFTPLTMTLESGSPDADGVEQWTATVHDGIGVQPHEITGPFAHHNVFVRDAENRVGWGYAAGTVMSEEYVCSPDAEHIDLASTITRGDEFTLELGDGHEVNFRSEHDQVDVSVDYCDTSGTLITSSTTFVRRDATAPWEAVEVYSDSSAMSNSTDGRAGTYLLTDDYAWLATVRDVEHGESLTPEQWQDLADQWVAEGTVPADKAWYVTKVLASSYAPESEPEDTRDWADDDQYRPDGPIVDTGRTADTTPALAAGLAGLALLGAGAGTLATSRRR